MTFYSPSTYNRPCSLIPAFFTTSAILLSYCHRFLHFLEYGIAIDSRGERRWPLFILKRALSREWDKAGRRRRRSPARRDEAELTRTADDVHELGGRRKGSAPAADEEEEGTRCDKQEESKGADNTTCDCAGISTMLLRRVRGCL